jgi:hypothetical protein
MLSEAVLTVVAFATLSISLGASEGQNSDGEF